MMYGYGWQTVLGGMLMIAFWSTAIWLIVSAALPERTSGMGHRALEVLDDRFARGEIDREELRTRKSVLEGGV